MAIYGVEDEIINYQYTLFCPIAQIFIYAPKSRGRSGTPRSPRIIHARAIVTGENFATLCLEQEVVMCLMCYLSTDKEIDKIPFDDSKPAFNVEKTDERPSGCTKQFVYYCGSSTHCGCNFSDAHFELPDELLTQTENEFTAGQLSYETVMKWWNYNVPPPKDQEEWQKQRQSLSSGRKDVNDLLALIQDIHRSGYDSELAFCWADDENIAIGATFDIDLAAAKPHVDFEIEFDAVMNNFSFSLYRFNSLAPAA